MLARSFASFKNKLVSITGAIINQVCSTVSATAFKTTHGVLSTPRFKAYSFLEDIYHPRFQPAKDNGFCIMEELRKIPIQTDYNSQVQFSSVGEAKVAMSADLLEACCSPLPGKFDSPQLYCNMSPYQQMLIDQRDNEENFDLIDYPDDVDDEAIISSQPTPEANVNLKKAPSNHLKQSFLVSHKISLL
ncbi:hypothetical protein MAM1_0022d01862 [Mucor ambiguus]|uniref:Uncharacterized protein n=1 Tax=Mucor ambiguus TaxID=91626 RepID=A0A0C9M6K9_9FUNG|nr:hypothetical protein MAM1_0022d01862 [Mucor ambiguus]